MKFQKQQETQKPQNQYDESQEEQKQSSKKGRVIIRNLVYDINEKHLQKLMSKFGTIKEITLPKNPATGKAKGYGFIQFENKNNALKAIKELNGSKFKGRSVVLDLAIAKDQYENKKSGKEKYGENQASTDDQQQQENKEQDIQLEEQKIEVVQQETIQKEEEQQQQQTEKDDDEVSMASYSESSDFEINHDLKDKMEDLDEEEDEEIQQEEEDEEDEEEDEEDEEEVEEEEDEKEINDEDEIQKQIDNSATDKREVNRKKQIEDKEDLSSTVFIRNISFNTTQTDFEDFFKQFGEIYFAKLVINHLTGDNKGTGFVKFKDPLVAQKVVQATIDYDNGEFALTGNPIDLELNGRRLICLESLKRDDADKKSAQFEKENKNKLDIKKAKNLEQVVGIDRHGKRRLKLARLGTFDPNLAKNEVETERRKKHLQEKLEKIKNPNNIVSVTRVAFKHLPKKAFDEIEIKQLISHFLEGLLTVSEIKKQKILRQVSLLRNEEKANQSRGIAFVEFAEQKYAEHFLREIQKNIEAFRKKCLNTLPIVEFAIEDIRKIRKIEQLRQKREQNQQDVKDMQNFEQNKEFREKQERLEKQEKLDKQQKNKADKKQKEKPVNQRQLNQQQKKQEELAAKLQLKDFLAKPKLSATETERAQELINSVKSRGAKQRLKQQLNNKFNLNLKKNENENESDAAKNPSVNQTILSKSQMKKEKDQKKKELFAKKIDAENELKSFQKEKYIKQTIQYKQDKNIDNDNNNSEIKQQRKQQEKALVNKIQAQIKNKRKAKDQIEQVDDLDMQIQKHLLNKQKQLKWDQQ